MDPTAWLNGNVPGFRELQAAECEAISHFTFLWSLFESKCLNRQANNQAIEKLVNAWASDNILDTSFFIEPLHYFRHRYFLTDPPQGRFSSLKVAENKRELVEKVLRGEDNDPVRCTTALLFVVYRLRNNLFHGEKWVYDLRDQKDNFGEANKTLIGALEIAGRR